MMAGIQLLGVIVGLFMLYLTYSSFKRAGVEPGFFYVWFLVWLGLIIFSIFPGLFSVFSKDYLSISRPLDLFFVLAIMGAFVLCFMLFIQSKQIYNKMNELEDYVHGKK